MKISFPYRSLNELNLALNTKNVFLFYLVKIINNLMNLLAIKFENKFTYDVYLKANETFKDELVLEIEALHKIIPFEKSFESYKVSKIYFDVKCALLYKEKLKTFIKLLDYKIKAKEIKFDNELLLVSYISLLVKEIFKEEDKENFEKIKKKALAIEKLINNKESLEKVKLAFNL